MPLCLYRVMTLLPVTILRRPSDLDRSTRRFQAIIIIRIDQVTLPDLDCRTWILIIDHKLRTIVDQSVVHRLSSSKLLTILLLVTPPINRATTLQFPEVIRAISRHTMALIPRQTVSNITWEDNTTKRDESPMATTLVRSATSILSVSDGWFITRQIHSLADFSTRRTIDTSASMQRRTIRFRPIYPEHASREQPLQEPPRHNSSLVVHRFVTL